ncbi:MAG TPA: tetratricopeptide repeat protein [Gemmataceae bacterium]|nr:tetratricopeptide repeat protein [Gemmataceae bacterium]
MPQRRTVLLIGLGLALLTAAAFGRSVGHDFSNYDDGDYVFENAHVQHGLNAADLAWAFTSTHAANWHPLTWLSLQLDNQLFGMRPGGYHLTNVLLHVANVVLLFLALLRLTGAAWRSAMAAALFAVHPLHVESVAWISERKDVLSTLFWMLTLLAYAGYAERPGVGRYLLVLLPFALGLMAKPMLVTLPCVLLLLDWWPLRRLQAPSPPTPLLPGGGEGPGGEGLSPRALAWGLLEKLPLFALTALSCGITVVAQRGAMVPGAALPFRFRVYNAALAYVGYLGKTLWPTDLACFYPYPRAWHTLPVLAAGLLLLAVTAGAVLLARRRPYLLTGWLWYLGTLVPVVGLVQVGVQAMADRYTYVPLIGIFLAVVWLAADLTAAWRVRRWLLPAVSAAVLAALAVRTWGQVGYWYNGETLWAHALAVNPENPEAHVNVGSVCQRDGKLAEAERHFRAALGISPAYAEAHCRLGIVLEMQGRREEALRHYEAALQVNPAHPMAHQTLGMALEKQGKLDEAVAHYQAALRTKPGNALLHNNLGVVLGKQGKHAEAARHFRAALAINPRYAAAHNNLGGMLVKQGLPAQAEPHFLAALEVEPRNAAAHFNLAVALEQQGKTEEAIRRYRTVLAINPHAAGAREALERLLR